MMCKEKGYIFHSLEVNSISHILYVVIKTSVLNQVVCLVGTGRDLSLHNSSCGWYCHRIVFVDFI